MGVRGFTFGLLGVRLWGLGLGSGVLCTYLNPTPETQCVGELSAASVSITLRVHVPNNWVLGMLVLVAVGQILGKYIITGHLDSMAHISMGGLIFE